LSRFAGFAIAITAGLSRSMAPSATAAALSKSLPLPKHCAALLQTRSMEAPMAARDYESQPETESLGIDTVIRGLCGDLEALRKGEISPQEAMARSALAKQIFNGFRIYLNGSKFLADQARPVGNQIGGKGDA
jgi:hypothetical protein